MLYMLGKLLADDTLKHFFLIFFQQTGFDISCKLSNGDNLHEMLNPVF